MRGEAQAAAREKMKLVARVPLRSGLEKLRARIYEYITKGGWCVYIIVYIGIHIIRVIMCAVFYGSELNIERRFNSLIGPIKVARQKCIASA